MSKNPLAPVHPGEILREEFLAPLDMSPYALAAELRVPRTRIERLVREETAVTPDTALQACPLLRHHARVLARHPEPLRCRNGAPDTRRRHRRDQAAQDCVTLSPLGIPSAVVPQRRHAALVNSASRPVSRVLSGGMPFRDGHSSGTRIAPRLKQPTRAAAWTSRCRLPRHPAAPIWSCSGWGLPCRSVTRGAVRSYRTVSPLPFELPRPAVCFLWHFPWGRPRWPLAATVDPGARTFLHRALVAAKPVHPAAAVRPAGRRNKGRREQEVKRPTRPCGCTVHVKHCARLQPCSGPLSERRGPGPMNRPHRRVRNRRCAGTHRPQRVFCAFRACSRLRSPFTPEGIGPGGSQGRQSGSCARGRSEPFLVNRPDRYHGGRAGRWRLFRRDAQRRSPHRYSWNGACPMASPIGWPM